MNILWGRLRKLTPYYIATRIPYPTFPSRRKPLHVICVNADINFWGSDLNRLVILFSEDIPSRMSDY